MNEATAAPDGVNRSSGSAVRLPTTVMTVSPAIRRDFFASAFLACLGLGLLGLGLLRDRPQHLGPQHRLVQVQLAVELDHRGGLGAEVDDGVDAFGLLVDLERQPATAPDVDLLHRAAVLLDDGEEGVEGRSDGPLVELGVEDDHDFVMAHGINPASCGLCGHGLSVAGGCSRPSRHRARRCRWMSNTRRIERQAFSTGAATCQATGWPVPGAKSSGQPRGLAGRTDRGRAGCSRKVRA